MVFRQRQLTWHDARLPAGRRDAGLHVRRRAEHPPRCPHRLSCRLSDLTPTLLDMVGSGIRMDHFDGQPVRAIYQPTTPHLPTPMFSRHIQQTPLPILTASASDENGLASKISQLSPDGNITLTSGQVMRAVFWDSVDLKAWQPVSYEPVSEYPDQPLTINHPASPYDLNNVAYNAVLFTELSVFRIMDDVISPLTRGRRPFMTTTDRVDSALRHHRSEWVSESANVIDLTNATFWDYQLTSQTNMHRIDSAVDYVQHRSQDIERKLAGVAEQPQLPGSRLLHGSVDATQKASGTCTASANAHSCNCSTKH